MQKQAIVILFLLTSPLLVQGDNVQSENALREVQASEILANILRGIL